MHTAGSVCPRTGINEPNDALLIPCLQRDPWEPSWTMLLSDPCVHRGTSTARLPPGSLPPLTLRCVHSHQLLSYVWPSLLLNLTKECHPGFLILIFYFFWALRHSAVCFNVFLPSELWENKEKAFFGSVLGHIKATACPPQRLGSAGAMSSPLSHSKDQPRIRKTTTDSSPTSLTARSLRVRLIEPVLACLL